MGLIFTLGTLHWSVAGFLPLGVHFCSNKHVWRRRSLQKTTVACARHHFHTLLLTNFGSSLPEVWTTPGSQVSIGRGKELLLPHIAYAFQAARGRPPTTDLDDFRFVKQCALTRMTFVYLSFDGFTFVSTHQGLCTSVFGGIRSHALPEFVACIHRRMHSCDAHASPDM